jgi:hypothetical protein
LNEEYVYVRADGKLACSAGDWLGDDDNAGKIAAATHLSQAHRLMWGDSRDRWYGHGRIER